MVSRKRGPLEHIVAEAFWGVVDIEAVPNDVLVVGDVDRYVERPLSNTDRQVRRWCRWTVGSELGVAWPDAHPSSGATLRIPKEKDALDLYINGAASVLKPGCPIWVYGANDEGIRSAGKKLSPLFENVMTIGTRRHCRIWYAERSSTPARTPLQSWSTVKSIELPDGPVEWHSYPGVFAKGGLDPATALLVSTFTSDIQINSVLDFCCGTGPIAAAIHSLNPRVELHLMDADAIALEAARKNVPSGIYYASDGWSCVPELKFDWIVSNPPIHRGREEDHRVLEQLVTHSRRYLAQGGKLQLVVQKRINVGRLFAGQFDNTACIEDNGRFQVWVAQ